MAGAQKSVLIHAPLEKVFEVIGDYERYPEFLSEVKSVRTSNRSGSQVDVHYELDLIKKIKYSLRLTEEKPNRVSWNLISGEWMKSNQGEWTLEGTPEGHTLARYAIEIGFGPLVPKAIVNALVEVQLPKMMEAFRKRIEQRI